MTDEPEWPRPELVVDNTAVPAGPVHWTSLLATTREGPRNSLSNVLIALRSAPSLKGRIGFDDMQRCTVLLRPLPYRARFEPKPFVIRPITDIDIGAIQEWLQINAMPTIGQDVCHQAVEVHAAANKFHPVRDWLDGLVWDGVPRLDDWLSTYAGVVSTPYSRGVGKMFLLSMVARIYEPGCKVDNMVVIEGPQGAAKSTLCEILATRDYFSDSLPDIRHGGKDLSQHLSGKLLIEVSELSAMSNADSESLKSFLSRREERYRPPYARRDIIAPRQCVFVGTTNKESYLHDETGARRYWPILCGIIDLSGLRRDREQLFAEALARYRLGDHWYPTREFEAEHIAPQQAGRFCEDAWESVINQWLSDIPPSTQVTIQAIGAECLGLELSRHTRADSNRIVKILRRLGWTKGPLLDGRPRYHSPKGWKWSAKSLESQDVF